VAGMLDKSVVVEDVIHPGSTDAALRSTDVALRSTEEATGECAAVPLAVAINSMFFSYCI